MQKAMSTEGITENEIYSQIRRNNLLNIDDVEAVVLELNGDMSVIYKDTAKGETSIKNIISDDKTK